MANQTTPSPQTEAGTSFAAWIADHRPLTASEISDILTQIQTHGILQGVTDTPVMGHGAPQPIPGAPAGVILAPQQWAGPQGSFATLSPSIKPEDIKPTTAFGQEFQDWVKRRDALTAREIADLKAQLEALKEAAAAAAAAHAQPTVKPELIIARDRGHPGIQNLHYHNRPRS
jgi:hypothetical protein